jgi:hypothetical protein
MEQSIQVKVIAKRAMEKNERGRWMKITDATLKQVRSQKGTKSIKY